MIICDFSLSFTTYAEVSTLFQKHCWASKSAVTAESEHFMLRAAVVIRCQMLKEPQLM